MLLSANGLGSNKQQVILSALVLSAHAPYGGDISISVPPIPGPLAGSDLSLISLSATIGPAAGLRYTERVHGHLQTYTPRGITIPERCPRGGFRFAAQLAFRGGVKTMAKTTVSCPQAKRRRARRGRRVH
jgi:hypothetical protein